MHYRFYGLMIYILIVPYSPTSHATIWIIILHSMTILWQKCVCFEILNKSLKQKKAAFINADDNYGRQILQWRQRYGYPLFSFGINNNADYHCIESSIQISIRGTQFATDLPFAKQFTMKLAGRFNVYNALGAIGVADFLNVPIGRIVTGISVLSSVPGRFDTILSPEGFAVVVDYAHTNDALEKLLLSVRSLKPERIITVFGCGGNRDKTKRPLMGKVSEEYSDLVIVTSDNPRKENPEAIIRDITAGMKQTVIRSLSIVKKQSNTQYIWHKRMMLLS